jgi:hypothetical protein
MRTYAEENIDVIDYDENRIIQNSTVNSQRKLHGTMLTLSV